MPTSNRKLQGHLRSLRQQLKAAGKRKDDTRSLQSDIVSVRQQIWRNKGKRWQFGSPPKRRSYFR